MNTNADPMISAVAEVTSVAEELRALRDKVKQYGDASKRINDLSDILQDLNGSVKKLQDAFTIVLGNSEKAYSQLEIGKQAVENLVASVPKIVKRIESSDVSKTVDGLYRSVKELASLVEIHQITLTEATSKTAGERAIQETCFNDITTRIDKLSGAVSHLSSETKSLQESSAQQFQKLRILSDAVVDEILPKVKASSEVIPELTAMLGASEAATSRAVDAMVDFAAKMLREMSTLRDEVAASKTLIEMQGQQLAELSKKKRGLFG